MAGRLHLDFESRSTAELSEVGVYEYAVHPNTDVWCACWCLDDGPIHTWFPGDELPRDLWHALADPATTVVAHNAIFEWHIIEYVCGPRYGWPPVELAQLNDTAARAAMLSLPRSLGQAAPAMGLEVEKDDEGRRLMMQMMKPRKPRKDEDQDAILWWDDGDRLKRLAAYCRRDVEVERELDHVLPELPATEAALWCLTAESNLRGVAVDTRLVEAADAVVQLAIADCDERLTAITDGELTATSQAAAIVRWLNERGIDTDSVAKDELSVLLDRDDLSATTREVLELRQEAAKSSTAKLAKFRQRTSADGRMRENLLYHAAGTGRWAGMGVQLQNMPRPELSPAEIKLAVEVIKDDRLSVRERVESLKLTFGSVPAAVSSCLRSCIVADNGNVLRVADYANIEGRTNAWQSHQTDKVELFHQGAKIYERMAGAVFGYDPSEISKESDERFLGKTLELGAGYGMGVDKFQQTCADQGLNISRDLAETSIQTFREVNARIKQFWYGLEEAAVNAVRSPGTVFDCRGVMFKVEHIGGVEFLLMRLPSGRRIYYPHVAIKPVRTPWGSQKDQITYMGTNPVTRKWERQKTYGGKLAENCIQGEARDVLASAMRRLEKNGYPVVLTVHDEIVAETNADFGSQEEFEKLMVKLPKWAKGCPVAVEGYTDTRYRK